MTLVGSGLSNIGNTCFLNATLQCLLHAPAFVRLLQLKTHSKQCSSLKNKWCVFCEMERLWQSTQQQRAVEPSGLARGLPTLFKKFRLGRQEDAHEFLRYVVEGLQKCDIDGSEKKPERIRQLVQASQLFRTFGGKMKSSIECLNCHSKSQITEHFYDMSLECQHSNSINESLEAYFKVDHLTGDNRYRCDKCKRLSNATKRFLFHRLPQILTIQLKRFTNNLRKLDKFVKYEPTMNLTKYCDSQQHQYLYELFGVVVHEGRSSSCGHYYAYVQAADLNWYNFDDSWVRRSNLKQSLSQKCYILFYRLVQPSEPMIKEVQGELSTESNNALDEEVEKLKSEPEPLKKEPVAGKIYERQPTGVNGVVQLVEKKQKSPEKSTSVEPPVQPKSLEKKQKTPDNSVLIEPINGKQPKKELNKKHPTPLKRTNSFLEELQEKKRKHQPTLLAMEKHFSIEDSKQPTYEALAFEENKEASERSSSSESMHRYVPQHPRPLKRQRCTSHQKALSLLRHYSREVKKRRLNESKQKN